MSRETFWAEIKARGVVLSDVDFDDEMQRIEDDSGDLMIEGAEIE